MHSLCTVWVGRGGAGMVLGRHRDGRRGGGGDGGKGVAGMRHGWGSDGEGGRDGGGWLRDDRGAAEGQGGMTEGRTALHDLLHHVVVAVRLLQLRGTHPDLTVGRDVLARLVQHLPRVLVVLESRQRQPQLRTQPTTMVLGALAKFAQHNAE